MCLQNIFVISIKNFETDLEVTIEQYIDNDSEMILYICISIITIFIIISISLEILPVLVDTSNPQTSLPYIDITGKVINSEFHLLS